MLGQILITSGRSMTLLTATLVGNSFGSSPSVWSATTIFFEFRPFFVVLPRDLRIEKHRCKSKHVMHYLFGNSANQVDFTEMAYCNGDNRGADQLSYTR